MEVRAFFSRAQSGALIREGSFTEEARSRVHALVAAGQKSIYPEIREASFKGEELFSADAHPQDVIRALEPLLALCARVGS